MVQSSSGTLALKLKILKIRCCVNAHHSLRCKLLSLMIRLRMNVPYVSSILPADSYVFTEQAGGAFTSSNYPHPYESNSRIEFLFHAPPEHLVIIVFKDFSIEGMACG